MNLFQEISRTCLIEGCSKKARTRGLCGTHYLQHWRAGKTAALPRQQAESGKGFMRNGYHRIQIGGNERFSHVLIAERALGHRLPNGAEVHHVNENKLDNRAENLVICPNHAYHFLLHQRTRALEACGHAGWRKCKLCKTYDSPENLYINKNKVFHRACNAEYQRNRRIKGECHAK